VITDTRVYLRGRVDGDLLRTDQFGEIFATFIVANKQLGPYREGGRGSRMLAWCDVVCQGELALNVLDRISAGDAVEVWGDLRVIKPLHDTDSVLVQLLAESVDIDRSRGHPTPTEPTGDVLG
jgi:single-stranded DNA-binding protein